MKKLAFGLSCLYLLYLCSCEKNSCQTFLQGSWVVRYPMDSAQLAVDSVFFFNGDSLMEKYKYHLPGDTNYQNTHTTYFITDKCDEVDFNGANTWAQYSSTSKYNILLITPNNMQIRSKSDASNCDSCIVSFYR
jgi:hypothetical protein